jgi:hypothetical protein
MSDDNKELLPATTKKLMLRALLRSLPLVPGPEVYDVLEDLRRSRSSIDQKIARAADWVNDY